MCMPVMTLLERTTAIASAFRTYSRLAGHRGQLKDCDILDVRRRQCALSSLHNPITPRMIPLRHIWPFTQSDARKL
jgi:hypothetical protein